MPQTNIPAAIEGFGEALLQRRQRLAQEQLKQQYATDLQETLANPSAQAFANLSTKYPQQREAFKQSWDMLNDDQKQTEFLVGVQAFNAINSGNVDVAKTLLDQRIEAMKNAGQNTRNLDAMRLTLDSDPKTVQAELGFVLSAVDPERWEKIAVAGSAIPKQQALTEEAIAKAKKAGIDAKFAEAEIVSRLNLNKAQIENYASQQEIARENLKIAKLNADLQREQNALKRQELQQKINEATQARDDKVNQKQSEANNVLATFDNALNSIDGLLGNWGKDREGKIDVTKPSMTVRGVTGPIQSRLPTVTQAGADFEENLASLESQAFLSQVDKMRGLGALTEREGGRLVNALGSLSLRQSPEQLGRNLLEIQRLMMKARTEVERKYGVTLPPDRPKGPGGAEVPPPQVPSAMGQAVNQVAPGMPSGFRVLGRETPR